MFITANTASQISWRKQHSLKERLALFKQSLQVLLQVPVSKVAACIIAEKPFDWIQRLLDALFVHNVQPAIGSIVYCNLLIAVEHTGIYVGNNKIVHLDGEGIVKLVSTKEFCQRLGGFNPANTVFCPTDVNGKPIGSRQAAKIALAQVNKRCRYNLGESNCHSFAVRCFTGKKQSTNSFTALETLLAKNYHAVCWRATVLNRNAA